MKRKLKYTCILSKEIEIEVQEGDEDLTDLEVFSAMHHNPEELLDIMHRLCLHLYYNKHDTLGKSPATWEVVAECCKDWIISDENVTEV